ncbi:hypothetical protein NQ317_012127, partial [Molorchus minor]
PSLSPVNARLASIFKAAVIKETGKPIEIEEKKIATNLNTVEENSLLFPDTNFPGRFWKKGRTFPDEQIVVGDRVAGLSLESFGGLAEQCVLDKDDVWRIPSELDKKDVAVIVYGHSTAIYAFAKLSSLKENERVMISAGPAGLGLAAVDVAANIYKTKVIGLVDDQKLAELVRNSGAFETLTFNEKLNKQCMKITENKGVQVVYDAAGGHMTETIGSCVSAGGKVFYASPIFYQTIPAPKPHSFATILSLKELRRQNMNMYKTVVSDTLELANEGLIGAHVSAKFSLSQINDAVKFIEDKKCTGKVVIHIDE